MADEINWTRSTFEEAMKVHSQGGIIGLSFKSDLSPVQVVECMTSRSRFKFVSTDGIVETASNHQWWTGTTIPSKKTETIMFRTEHCTGGPDQYCMVDGVSRRAGGVLSSPRFITWVWDCGGKDVYSAACPVWRRTPGEQVVYSVQLRDVAEPADGWEYGRRIGVLLHAKEV